MHPTLIFVDATGVPIAHTSASVLPLPPPGTLLRFVDRLGEQSPRCYRVLEGLTLEIAEDRATGTLLPLDRTVWVPVQQEEDGKR